MKTRNFKAARAFGALLFSGLLISSFSGIPHSAYAADQSASDENYDRLDGTGASGKKVNVIEWEGNLEVHVYPAGSLKGLALKLDKTNKDKPVMIIGYRFNEAPEKQLIRRAILGINMHDGFKAYRDTTADGYDKIVISNNGLENVMAVYKLEAAPTQLYPDGHPALLAQAADQKRTPAATRKEEAQKDEVSDSEEQESGTISPFFMRETHSR